ncbi:MAG: DUF2339 domain-containing protein, partial [Bacteroidota bacterium]
MGITLAVIFMLLSWTDTYEGWPYLLGVGDIPSPGRMGWYSLSTLMALGVMYFMEEGLRKSYNQAQRIQRTSLHILKGCLLVLLSFMLGWLELNTRLLPHVQSEHWIYLHLFAVLWIYTLSFSLALGWLNQIFWKKKLLHYATTFAGFVAVLIWAFVLSRDLGSFHQAIVTHVPQTPSSLLTIRYMGHLIAMGFLLNAVLWARKVEELSMAKVLEICLLFLFVSLFSYEGWLQYHAWTGFEDYELAVSRYTRVIMSISWAVMALGVVGLGFIYKAAHWRLSAILLLGVALVKLIIWDMVNVSLGLRTVLFLVLGGILLLISYLYQRKNQVSMMKQRE